MVSILDTLIFESFSGVLGLRRYKEGEKITRGEGYTDCWKKAWGAGPCFVVGPGKIKSTTGVDCLPAATGVVIGERFSAALCQERP